MTNTTTDALSTNTSHANNASYSITLPTEQIALTAETKTGLASMTANSIPATPGMLFGSDSLAISAKVVAANNQPAGNYSGNFPISIEYN